MRFLATVGGLFLIGLAASLIYLLSGTYDVAATRAHPDLVEWFLDTTMTRSVRKHAREVSVPPPSDPSLLKTGSTHYESMCEDCHGAPGVEPSEMGKGLNPSPPLLTEAAGDWSPAELFWIVKHGVKMTGMPAFGPTHGDDDLRAIVAFVEKLPSLSPEEYRTVIQGGEGHEHGHGEEEADSHTEH